MANQQHLDLLKQGVTENWNRWRLEFPDTRPELQAADLMEAKVLLDEVPGVPIRPGQR